LEIDDAWNLGEPSHELLRQLGELGVVWPKNGDHDRLPADRCREARHAVDPLANLSLDLFLRRSRTQLAIRQSNQKPSVVAAVSRPNSGDDSLDTVDFAQHCFDVAHLGVGVLEARANGRVQAQEYHAVL